MADTFPANEPGSGRLTPLVDAPSWLKLQAQREDTANGDCTTLTPLDQAFLDSEPSYEGREALPASLAPPPPPRPVPSQARRVGSLLLFVSIAGAACAVLALAALRALGHVVFN